MIDNDLRDFEEWQAVSHPDLASRKPTELFTQEFAEVYERLHTDLWWRIIDLHGTLCSLELLKEFPFHYLYRPNGMEFWELVECNFLEMTIIRLHSIVNDQEHDAHTIRKFKNSINQEPWVDNNLRNVFRKSLRECKFDKRIDSVAESVRDIRHSAIAHRILDPKTGYPKNQLPEVSLQELRRLFNSIHRLFGVLSFGSSYVTLIGDLMPGMIDGQPTRTCLDEVLDAILKDSYWINEPEKNSWWQDCRKHKSSEELQFLNKYRKRIGLAKA